MSMKMNTLFLGLVLSQAAFALPMGFEIISGQVGFIEEKESNLIRIQCQTNAEILWDSFNTSDQETVIFEMEADSLVVTNKVKNREKENFQGVLKSNGDLNFVFDGGLQFSGALIASGKQIELKARSISLNEGAVLDVSGEQLGGNLLIFAEDMIEIDSSALLLANCFGEGKAGNIIVKGENTLKYFGSASASGLHPLAAAGFIEFSGQGAFQFKGDTQLTSPLGSGTLLIDPQFIQISPDGTASAEGNTFDYLPDETVIISDITLNQALSNGNVILQANSDIVFSRGSLIYPANNNSLTLQAGRSVQIQELTTINLNNADFAVSINNENAISEDRQSGTAQFIMQSFASIATVGGTISVDVGEFGGVQVGEVILQDATLNSGSGSISLKGIASTSGSGIGIALSSTYLNSDGGNILLIGRAHQSTLSSQNYGIMMNSGGLIVTGTGYIEMDGVGGSQEDFNIGVYLVGSTDMISAQDGSINIIGVTNGTGDNNCGIRIDDTVGIRSQGSAEINMSGTSYQGASYNYGIFLGKSLITSQYGPVVMTGTTQGNQDWNVGIRVEGGEITSTGTGAGAATLTLTGMGGDGTGNDFGVSIAGSTALITSIDGNIEIDGTGRGEGTYVGVQIEYPENVNVTGSGTITITSIP